MRPYVVVGSRTRFQRRAQWGHFLLSTLIRNKALWSLSPRRPPSLILRGPHAVAGEVAFVQAHDFRFGDFDETPRSSAGAWAASRRMKAIAFRDSIARE